VAGAEAYLGVKFDLDPCNCLATIHQRYRHTGQKRKTGQWSDSIGKIRVTNGRLIIYTSLFTKQVAQNNKTHKYSNLKKQR